MSFDILNPMLLWGVALIALPLLIHLFARTRPPVYKFSSIEFIRKILRSTMRIKRPQDILVLILRTLLFAGVVFVFLQPVYFARKTPANPFESKNVVLVVDSTASMGYVEGAQTRFAAACAEASEILAGLNSRDRANIVWLDSDPDAVFPEPGMNFSFLQNELRRARVSSEAGNIEAAFRMALKMLEGSVGRKEIYLVSDFQKSAWAKADLSAPTGVETVSVPIGGEGAGNSAIADVHFLPATPLVGENITILVEVCNFSSQPRQRSVYLSMQDTRLTQDLLIPAWGKTTAMFSRKPTAAGMFPVEVSLSEDDFPGDDRRWAVMQVREFLTVGIVSMDPGTGKAWKRVMESVGWARPELLTQRDLAGALPYDVLMVAGWDGSSAANLTDRAGKGMMLVCMPAEGVRWSDIVSLFGTQAAATSGEIVRKEESEKGYTLRVVGEKDELFKLFADGRYGDPSRGVFRSRLSVPENTLAGGAALLAYSDGIPALVRFRRNSYFWNLPLDSEKSNWAAQKEFLPFVAELLLTSRTAVKLPGLTGDSPPGRPLAWNLEEEISAYDIVCKNGNGADLSVKMQDAQRGVAFLTEQVRDPGLYSWEHKGRILGYSPVNFPAVESDLRIMTKADIEKSGVEAVSGGVRARQLREGLNMWPYLLALGLAAALLEGMVLLWTERS